MERKINVALFLLCLFFSFNVCADESKKFDINNIYGDWVYEKNTFWPLGKFGPDEINQIKAAILHVEKNQMYFSGIKEPHFEEKYFIGKCSFSDIKYKDFFDQRHKTEDFYEDGGIALHLSSKELAPMKKVTLNCNDTCLGLIFMSDKNLILNYCGGATIYFKKIKN